MLSTDDTFLRSLKDNNFSDRTINLYQKNIQLLNGFLEKTYNLKSAQDLRKEHIQSFIIYINNLKRKKDKKDYSVNTKALIRDIIKKYLEYLHQEGIILRDFTYLFENIKYSKKLTDNLLTEKQISDVVNCININTYLGYRNRTIIELLYGTGIRKSELINLQIYDIDFEEKKLFIKQGKGKKDRIVPFGRVVGNFLQEYIENVRPILLEENQRESWVFIGAQAKPLKAAGLEAMLYKYANISRTPALFRYPYAEKWFQYCIHPVYSGT